VAHQRAVSCVRTLAFKDSIVNAALALPARHNQQFQPGAGNRAPCRMYLRSMMHAHGPSAR